MNINFRRKLLLFFLGALILFFSGCFFSALATDSQQTPKIAVRLKADGSGEFYNTGTGETFIPRGNNYYHYISNPDCGHSTFNIGKYNATAAENALKEMENYGYNIVRVFINNRGNQKNASGTDSTGCGGIYTGLQTTPGVNLDYMNNVIDFLRRARNHNIRVIFTKVRTPLNYNSIINSSSAPANVERDNNIFMHQGYINAQAAFWKDVITAIKNIEPDLINIVFGYDLWNEAIMDGGSKPFSLTSGQIKPADGGTYDMASAASRQQLIKNSAKYWANQISAAIKSVDPQALVTTSLPHFTNFIPMSAFAESSFDFLDVHVYLGLMNVVNAYNLSSLSKNKPLILGEFGPYPSYDFNGSAVTLRDWQISSCNYGFDGWLLWSWNDGRGSTAMDTLSPIKRPNACSATVSFNNAQFISQSISTSMITGQTYQVSITLKNTGTTTWTKINKYRLGSQNARDNLTWGISRVDLSDADSISSNQQKTFNFTIKAPSAPGNYNFQWRMLKEGVEWFGDLTSNVSVNVSVTTTPSTTLNFNSNSTSITSGQSFVLSWSSTNATSCSASGAWSGSKTITGSQSVSPTATSTFTLTCTGTGGSVSKSLTINVSVAPDITSPSVPTNLTTTAISSPQINLSWTASTDNVGVVGYEVYRCQGTNCSPTTQIATSTTNSYSDTGLSPSTTYVYKVAAYDVAGNVSGLSVSATATTLASPLTPPSFPSNLSISTSTCSSIGISWQDNSNNETGFKIERKTGTAGIWSQIATTTANIASCSNTGLSANTTYYNRVRAYNSAGNSNYSNETGLTTPNCPIASPVLTFSASPVSITSGQSSALTWSSTNATTCTASGAWSGSKAISGTQSVSPTATSTYILTCTGSGGSTNKSVTVNVSQSTVVPVPTLNLSANPVSVSSGQFATLTWSSSNVSACVASGDWSGAKTTSSSETVSLFKDSTYTLTCTGQSGTVSKSATIAYVIPSENQCAINFISNGTVSSYPSCTVTCNSGYVLSGNSCVAVSQQQKTCPITGILNGSISPYPECKIICDNNYALEFKDDNTYNCVSVSSTPSLAPVFSRNLRLGIQGNDVKGLQEYLSQDKTIYPEGLVTGYFGNLTQKAIQKFQCKYNIVCSGDPYSTGYGSVGPKTRVKLNEMVK